MRAFPAENVARVFDDSHLEAETETEERNVVLAGVADGFYLACSAPRAESTGDDDAVRLAESLGVGVLHLVGVDPEDVHVDAHLAERAPSLCAPDCQYLFPATRKAGPVSGNRLSERIKKRVRNEIGVEMNAHLFRHLAVMIYLDANPGGYEVARQMLGHSSVSRTISVYSGLETIKATQAFANVVDTLRDGV